MNKAIIDIETGGFSKSKNGICEIGMLVIDEKNQSIGNYSTLIKPYLRPESEELVSYKEDAMAIHGITEEELIEEGDEPTAVCLQIIEFLKSYDCNQYIGHSIKTFDAPRLKHFFQRFGNSELHFGNCIDTLEMARKKLPQLKSHTLSDLCTFYKIDNHGEHRAIGDCGATLELYKKLL